MTRDLALLGPWPPPYGGISVHLQRLVPVLVRAGLDPIVYNTGSDASEGDRVRTVHRGRRLWYATFPLTVREPVVHFHVPHDALARAIAWPVSWRARVVHTFHNARGLPAPDAVGGVQRALVGRMLRSASAIHAVTAELAPRLEAWGVPRERISVFPAYLPPDPAGARGFPADLTAFLEAHTPSLVAIGDPRRSWEGAPLYGLDLAIDAVGRLASTHPGIGLLVFLHSGARFEDAATAALTERAARAGVANRVRLVALDGPSWPALRDADLYLRPTRSDGDSLAVREALDLGTPVVASAVGTRPEGVHPFEAGSLDALVEAVASVCEDLEAARVRVANATRPDPSGPVLDLYERVLGRPLTRPAGAADP